MRLIDYPDADIMMMDLSDLLASEINSALMTHDQVTLAVPGGTTPGPVFDTLSAVHLDWARVTVTLTDERWVPPDHPRSNARLVRERLLVGPAAAATLLPLYSDGDLPEQALPRLTDSLKAHLPVSVLLLGMGDDMHTASLFPGADGLTAALSPTAPPLAVLRPASQPEPRVSLTAPVLSGALACHLVVKGKRKRDALERAQTLSVREAPVQSILADATVHWAQ